MLNESTFRLYFDVARARVYQLRGLPLQPRGLRPLLLRVPLQLRGLRGLVLELSVRRPGVDNGVRCLQVVALQKPLQLGRVSGEPV